MGRFMNEILQTVKTKLESVLTDQKVSICLSDSEIVRSSERDVVRIHAEKSSKIKNYPGFGLCKYEIGLTVEVFIRKREETVSVLSELLGSIENAISQMSVSIGSEEYLGLHGIGCKTLEYPKTIDSVKNKNVAKILASFEIYEE